MPFNINNIIAGLDKLAHTTLADDVVVERPEGSTTIQAMFEWRNDSDELVDRMDDSYPILDEILEADGHLFDDWDTIKIHYRGEVYSVLSFNPKNDRNYTAVLRVERIDI